MFIHSLLELMVALVGVVLCAWLRLVVGDIQVTSRQLNISSRGEPSFLPPLLQTNKLSEPLLSDSCPDDIWENLITHAQPKLPFRIIDGYDRSQKPGELPVILYETEELKVTVYPQFGGKVASVWSKTANYELVFDNPVFQPAALGRLNGWCSGGIEWNYPRFGHSQQTLKPVFASVVETKEKGPLLRVYEYDREFSSIWQVDLLIANGSLFAHVTLTNRLPEQLEAYWWTNIGVPWHSNKTRVLVDCPYAIMSSSFGLRPQAFPNTDDCGFNPEFSSAQDHSFPSNFGTAREVFLRPPNTTSNEPYRWHAFVNGSGYGLIHTQSVKVNGRKFWAWGQDPFDDNRMRFLSSNTQRNAGDYFEMQSGIAPTQFQTFPFAPSSTISWTEVFSPLDVSDDTGTLSKLLSPNYKEAIESTRELVTGVVSEELFTEIDEFLDTVSDVKETKMLWQGSGWAELEQERLGHPLKPGLNFSYAVDEETQPWYELLKDGTFSQTSLQSLPYSYQVRPEWTQLLEESVKKHNSTWLHCLHLGIAASFDQNFTKAFSLFQQSNAHQKNVLAIRNLAWLAANGLGDGDVTQLYLEAWQLALAQRGSRMVSDGLIGNLAGEIAEYKFTHGEPLSSFYESIPSFALEVNYVRFAAVAVALEKGQYAEAVHLLQSTPFTYPAGGNVLVTWWYDAHYKLHNATTLLEQLHVRRAFPPPFSIDFRGAT
eukprot:m.203837 g.203837  ORF g.203837 m.203837 type:complete len:711 (-) comp26011_c0_seq5:53-2185(-)